MRARNNAGADSWATAEAAAKRNAAMISVRIVVAALPYQTLATPCDLPERQIDFIARPPSRRWNAMEMSIRSVLAMFALGVLGCQHTTPTAPGAPSATHTAHYQCEDKKVM